MQYTIAADTCTNETHAHLYNTLYTSAAIFDSNQYHDNNYY